MKRIFLLIISVGVVSLANAQIARWLIEPNYDGIRLADGIDAIVTDSGNYKILWSLDGKQLNKTSNTVYPFKENRAVSVFNKSTVFACIFNEQGEVIHITENGEPANTENCNIISSFPYYSNGKLLVIKDQLYRFIGADGAFGTGHYKMAYPYFNGYAKCVKYVNLEKQKIPYNALIYPNEEKVTFNLNGKNVDDDDLDFISSVNDENIAVVVIKNKIYFFDGEKSDLTPVFADENESANKKNQAKLEDDISKCLTKVNTSYILTARCGKEYTMTFEFDKMYKPVSFSVNNELKKKYIVREETKKEITSPFSTYSEGGTFQGINCDDQILLPPQFDKVVMCYGQRALVRLNGKYGMLTINKDARFTLKINDGKSVPFLHRTFETTVRVDMPVWNLSDKTYLEFAPDRGIELDKTSIRKANTEFGNYVLYNCVLTIPEDLTDEEVEIEYPVQVSYNGLKSPVIPFKIIEWFVKKFVVDEDESQRKVENGTLTFVFNISNQYQSNSGSIVKSKVDVVSDDSLIVKMEECLSITRYKYKVMNLKEGVNNIEVQIVEEGCPPSVFSFDIVYHKPVPKTKTTEAEEETVEIKKTNKKRKAKGSVSNPSPILKI